MNYRRKDTFQFSNTVEAGQAASALRENVNGLTNCGYYLCGFTITHERGSGYTKFHVTYDSSVPIDPNEKGEAEVLVKKAPTSSVHIKSKVDARNTLLSMPAPS